MEGNPVTIRFLDPPLHEFVPTEEADIEKLAKAKGKTVAEIKAICESLHEFKPDDGSSSMPSRCYLPGDCSDADQGCYPRREINVKKAHPDLEHRSGDYDPAYRRYQRVKILQEDCC